MYSRKAKHWLLAFSEESAFSASCSASGFEVPIWKLRDGTARKVMRRVVAVVRRAARLIERGELCLSHDVEINSRVLRMFSEGVITPSRKHVA